MRAHQSLKKSCAGYRRASMGAQTPKAAGSNAPYLSTDTFCPPPPADVDSMTGVMDAAGPAWSSTIISSQCASREEGEQQHGRRWSPERDDRSSTTRSTHTSERAIPDQLAELLIDMIPGMEGAELGEAFQCAAEQPPVTKQSLSELDIQNIITNIKLRHDVNFDKDLSFRPNLDGPRGQEKKRHSEKYWQALVAELELYVRLFQGSPSMGNMDQAKWAELTKHAQRRVPKMFRTIHEVLKSLVPDRDHARVDEHFDVSMLVQEIERDVCDLVKKVEWVAGLLKEHCAPMRDVFVDKMVQSTRQGVARNSSSLIISGLCELLGILEAMKLDVANHQIRNLKTLLIEDTVNFERHYQLDRLVNKRSKVNMDAAQKWWTHSARRLTHRCDPNPKDVPRLQLEIFTQAVVSGLFAMDGLTELPDTFYLDQDRLRVLKSEVDDLIHLEICFDMFGQCLKEFGYSGPISASAQMQLRNALSAIVGESVGHVHQSWMYHSEALSLEVYRQAILLSGRPFTYDFHDLQRANEHLQRIFQYYFSSYSSKVRAMIFPQVLACTNKHYTSSPIELFNSLIVPTPICTPLGAYSFLAPPPPPPPLPLPANTFSPSSDRIADITNRITHIVLLHWRVWGPIAYVQEDGTNISNSNNSMPETQSSPQTLSVHLSTPEQAPVLQLYAPLPKSKKTTFGLLVRDTEMSELNEEAEDDIRETTELP